MKLLKKTEVGIFDRADKVSALFLSPDFRQPFDGGVKAFAAVFVALPDFRRDDQVFALHMRR